MNCALVVSCRPYLQFLTVTGERCYMVKLCWRTCRGEFTSYSSLFTMVDEHRHWLYIISCRCLVSVSSERILSSRILCLIFSPVNITEVKNMVDKLICMVVWGFSAVQFLGKLDKYALWWWGVEKVSNIDSFMASASLPTYSVAAGCFQPYLDHDRPESFYGVYSYCVNSLIGWLC